VFAAAAANEVVLCMHIGSSAQVPSVSDDSPYELDFDALHVRQALSRPSILREHFPEGGKCGRLKSISKP
jgi:hypothetical protein